MESGKHVYSAVPVISVPDDREILDWCGGRPSDDVSLLAVERTR